MKTLEVYRYQIQTHTKYGILICSGLIQPRPKIPKHYRTLKKATWQLSNVNFLLQEACCNGPQAILVLESSRTKIHVHSTKLFNHEMRFPTIDHSPLVFFLAMVIDEGKVGCFYSATLSASIDASRRKGQRPIFAINHKQYD